MSSRTCILMILSVELNLVIGTSLFRNPFSRKASDAHIISPVGDADPPLLARSIYSNLIEPWYKVNKSKSSSVPDLSSRFAALSDTAKKKIVCYLYKHVSSGVMSDMRSMSTGIWSRLFGFESRLMQQKNLFELDHLGRKYVMGDLLHSGLDSVVYAATRDGRQFVIKYVFQSSEPGVLYSDTLVNEFILSVITSFIPGYQLSPKPEFISPKIHLRKASRDIKKMSKIKSQHHCYEPNGCIVEYMIIERVGVSIDEYSDLVTVTNNNLKELDLIENVGLLKQSVLLVEKLHSMGIVHNDLHLGNICFRERDEGELVLIDYGMATVGGTVDSLSDVATLFISFRVSITNLIPPLDYRKVEVSLNETIANLVTRYALPNQAVDGLMKSIGLVTSDSDEGVLYKSFLIDSGFDSAERKFVFDKLILRLINEYPKQSEWEHIVNRVAEWDVVTCPGENIGVDLTLCLGDPFELIKLEFGSAAGLKASNQINALRDFAFGFIAGISSLPPAVAFRPTEVSDFFNVKLSKLKKLFRSNPFAVRALSEISELFAESDQLVPFRYVLAKRPRDVPFVWDRLTRVENGIVTPARKQIKFYTKMIIAGIELLHNLYWLGLNVSMDDLVSANIFYVGNKALLGTFGRSTFDPKSINAKIQVMQLFKIVSDLWHDHLGDDLFTVTAPSVTPSDKQKLKKINELYASIKGSNKVGPEVFESVLNQLKSI